MAKATNDPKYTTVAQIELVKMEHFFYKLSVYKKVLALDVDTPIEPYTECCFGKWYYGPDGQKLAHYEEFKALEDPHRLMHVYAAEAVELLKAGKYLEGVDKVNKIEQSSVTIAGILDYLATHIMKDSTNESADRQETVPGNPELERADIQVGDQGNESSPSPVVHDKPVGGKARR